jgi:hypothetical protein
VKYLSVIRSEMAYLTNNAPNNPCDHTMVKRLLKGVASELGREVKKARPMTLDDLDRICAKFSDPDRVWDCAIVFLSLLCFWACLRLGNVIPKKLSERSAQNLIRFQDISRVDQALHLRIGRSKTNFSGAKDPHLLVLTDPRLLQAFENLRRVLNPAPSDLLARYSAKKSHSFTRGRFVDLINSALEVRVSGHSFRRGYVIAAMEAGIPMEIIMLMGDWKDVRSVLSYARGATPNLSVATQVNQAINLMQSSSDLIYQSIQAERVTRRQLFPAHSSGTLAGNL